jgi:hypothetical protein
LGSALADINMLVLLGAQGHTAAEYDALLAQAGFTTTAVHATRGAWTVIESTKQ